MPKSKKIDNNKKKNKELEEEFKDEFEDEEEDEEEDEQEQEQEQQQQKTQRQIASQSSEIEKPKIRSISTSLKKYRTVLDKYKQGLEDEDFEMTDDDELDLRMINMLSEWLAKKVKKILDSKES